MAEPRPGALGRAGMTLAAVAATLFGWLALAARAADVPEATVGPTESALLPPLPALEPALDAPRPPRRPAPIVVTRSSR